MPSDDDTEEEKVCVNGDDWMVIDTISENYIEKQPTLMELEKDLYPLNQIPRSDTLFPMEIDISPRGTKRKLNASYDLVGIESNPGPNATGKKKNTQRQTAKGKNVGMVGKIKKNLVTPGESRAAPGRNPQPTRMNMGFNHLVPYMRCLNNPFDFPPSRPGVACALPTGLITCYLRVPYAAGANTSFIFNPNRMAAPIMSSVTQSSNYNFGQSQGDFPQKTAVTALYEKVRLLAAGVRLIPAANSTADSGLIASALIPGLRSADINSFGQITTTTAIYGFNEYPTFPQAALTPFKNGVTVLWRPQDPNSFVFREAPLTDTAGSIADSLQDQPFMVVGVSGLAFPTGGTPFIIEFIAHYEGIIAAGNAGVIELSRAPPTPDAAAIAAADRVFGEGNRTSYPSTTDSFMGYHARVGDRGGRGKGSSLWKDLADFGSSVAPVIGAIGSLFL